MGTPTNYFESSNKSRVVTLGMELLFILNWKTDSDELQNSLENSQRSPLNGLLLNTRNSNFFVSIKMTKQAKSTYEMNSRTDTQTDMTFET